RLAFGLVAAAGAATTTTRGCAALAAGRSGQVAVLGEAALFAGHARAALAGDLAAAFGVHRGEAPAGARLVRIQVGHELLLLWRRVGEGARAPTTRLSAAAPDRQRASGGRGRGDGRGNMGGAEEGQGVSRM